MEHKHDDKTKHPKQDFQVERLAFFSDAVFAIAITLLIIEFKVPHVTKDSTLESVWNELLQLKNNLFSLLLSYFLIAVYWIRHHFLYKYLHDYNKHIVVANLVSLLPIIFLPFTTAFFAECAENPNTMILGYQVFFVNHFAAGISIFVLYWLGMVKHKHLSYEVPVKDKLKFYEQTLFSSLIFIALFITTLLSKDKNTMFMVIAVCVAIRYALMSLLKKKLGSGNNL